MTITVSDEQYNSEVIYKCFYWYTGIYNINIIQKPGLFEIHIELTNNQQTEEAISNLKNRISRDLIDFKLRDIIDKETKTIRELIIAKAFAWQETDNNVPGNASDKIGFDPDNTGG